MTCAGRSGFDEIHPEVASATFDCYVCTFNWNPLLKTYLCVTAPWNVTTGSIVTPCQQYCTTQRQYDHGEWRHRPTAVRARWVTSSPDGSTITASDVIARRQYEHGEWRHHQWQCYCKWRHYQRQYDHGEWRHRPTAVRARWVMSSPDGSTSTVSDVVTSDSVTVSDVTISGSTTTASDVIASDSISMTAVVWPPYVMSWPVTVWIR